MRMSAGLIGMMSVLAALSVSAAEPRVGCTVALRGGYGPQQYQSNALFKHRPVAERMARDGIDLCLYNGWDKADAVKSLKQFNCLWLLTDHEDECPYDAETVGRALKAYVEQGGGLVVSYASGRYPEAPVDAFWTKVFAMFGLEILHEEVADFTTRFRDPSVHQQEFFHVATFTAHPVTQGETRREIRVREAFERFLSLPRVEVLPVMRRTGRCYATVFNFCRASGSPMPTNDLWIAAAALETGAVILTADAHLRRLPLVRTEPVCE